MIRMMHYLYTLSTWSLVAETAVARARRTFGVRLQYDWSIAITDYGGSGGLRHDELDFYYSRLQAATGETMNLGWWREGYDWLVPDKVVTAARLLGSGSSDVRLAIANAGLRRGEDITNVEVAVDIASRTAGFDRRELREMVESPQTLLELFRGSQAFKESGVRLRPAFILENDLGDRAILSGIWTIDPLESAIAALLTDEESYREFVKNRPPPPGAG